MNDFIKRTKADNKTMQMITDVEKIYANQSRRMEFKDKVTLAVYSSIAELKTESIEEQQLKQEYLSGINKFLANYEQIYPIMMQILEDKDKGKNSK